MTISTVIPAKAGGRLSSHKRCEWVEMANLIRMAGVGWGVDILIYPHFCRLPLTQSEFLDFLRVAAVDHSGQQ